MGRIVDGVVCEGGRRRGSWRSGRTAVTIKILVKNKGAILAYRSVTQ
jgi:hypothetical protein